MTGEIRILSRSAAPFADRREAGELLARALVSHRHQRPIVLGIPRGGVVLAAEIANGLPAELEIVLSRKIGAPQNPEVAIGAVAEDGQVFVDEAISRRLGVSPRYLAQEQDRQLQEIARRIVLYRGGRPKQPLRERFVIITDDGLATGATMQAALWAVNAERPASVLVAVPVGAADTVERLAASADGILCLRAPEAFGAVGQFYRRFDQVTDAEVVAILSAARPPRRDS